jgi:hypothetical protein
LVAAWIAVPAHAQYADSPGGQAPAHVSFVDGTVVLERDGQIDNEPGNMPLLAGDRLRTRGGRVEVLFADGSTLHLDHNSAVDLQSDELIRLVDGRIRLTIPGPDRAVAYRIDGPSGWARITEPGEYRIALLNGPGGRELELAVLRGAAELANEGGQTMLRAGERAFARAGAAPSLAYVANSAALDAFDRWSEMRRDERMSANAEYLPDEVRPYAASFETYGYWRDEPTYGRVWYPRVAPDWRPYYRGRWVNLRPYGWTWVAHDPWGWPTHHYGRWGYSSAGAWFWIPGRSWGAAWVSWAYAPGYVSWCPLGWNNRPIFSLNINIGGWGHYPWRGWTVIPRRHFGYGYVHRTFVRASHLDSRIRGSFAHGDRPPEIRGYAVPRAAAPIRVAGTDVSRRGTSPLYTNRPVGQERIRTDGARIRVPSGSAPDRGARPSTTSRAVPRERAVPTAPAVRSERPADRAIRSGEAGAAAGTSGRAIEGARPRTGVTSGAPADPRRASAPTAVPRDTRRFESPRSSAPAAPEPRADEGRRAVPRYGTAPRSTAPARRPGGGEPAYRSPSGPAGPSRPPAAIRPESRPPTAIRPESRPPAAVSPSRPAAGARPSAPSARPANPGGRPSSEGARPSSAGGGPARPKAVPRGGGGGSEVR